ncbi:MAG TPA: ATP-binding protein [Polyangia bacterium]|nr:ATP-binding protein [Polyangia bacterium]
MSALPPDSKDDRTQQLQRCIRDLVALNALPSLCVGRTSAEVLEIIVEALPTALGCDLVYIRLPGSPAIERGQLAGRSMSASELAEVAVVTVTDADGADAQVFLAGGRAFCLEAEIPIGTERGRLLAGRREPLDPEIDRVLVRTAANVVGTIVATANVLEVARRKDDFLAMLGHELRNPLAPILTAVELLGRHPSAARERGVIDRHTQHLVRLVDDLLDISRVTRGSIELRREYVSLTSVLERAVEIAAPLIARNGHQLQVADAGDLTLRGDPFRLAQIFGNLLNNAAKFTPPGGKIEVLIERLPGRVRVTVRDNGCGIARDQMTRIFEPFVQADRERDALQGGLGLGLAIVSSLAQRHEGTVSVDSEGRGRGTAFVVDLPTATGFEPPKSTVPAQPIEARANVRVLVVDDNADLAELLSDALQGEGFQTSVAHDGRGALTTWRRFLPHAGVLDVGLPDLDGYALARALRAEHGQDATLIAATGYGQPADRSRAQEAGFDCHLVKPVSVHELALVLDERIVSAVRDPTEA